MCGGVYYSINDQDVRVYFPNPKAMLPVLKKNGELQQLPWGRRNGQQGKLPLGGWARLESIYQGRWDRWFPTPVKIPIRSFMEKDLEGVSHWFDLVNGQFIQGLIARNGNEQRLYIVTITPEMDEAVHERWPRVVSG